MKPKATKGPKTFQSRIATQVKQLRVRLRQATRAMYDANDLLAKERDAFHFAVGEMRKAAEATQESTANLSQELAWAKGIERNLAEDLKKALDDNLALAKRRDELLALVAKLSQTTPLQEELEGWEGQRAAMIAEIGTLKARVAELERLLACARELIARSLERDAERVADEPHISKGATLLASAESIRQGTHAFASEDEDALAELPIAALKQRIAELEYKLEAAQSIDHMRQAVREHDRQQTRAEIAAYWEPDGTPKESERTKFKLLSGRTVEEWIGLWYDNQLPKTPENFERAKIADMLQCPRCGPTMGQHPSYGEPCDHPEAQSDDAPMENIK